jgi:hypothetical protein
VSVSEKNLFAYVSVTPALQRRHKAERFLLSSDKRISRLFPGFEAPSESGHVFITHLRILSRPTGSRGFFRSGAVKNDFLVLGKLGEAGLKFL